MSLKDTSKNTKAFEAMFTEMLKNKEMELPTRENLSAVLKEMTKAMVDVILKEELSEFLGYDKYDTKSKESTNSRNGYSSKTLHTEDGDIKVAIPRDREGEFEPNLIKKHENTLTAEIEEKLISMYAKGMTQADISSHLKDLYGIEASDSTISRITDKVIPLAKEWQNRPLKDIYAVVYMDAIHFHVRTDGRVVNRAVYVMLGLDMEGYKDVLGMYIGENEGAKFWATMINNLSNRGVKDILITCVDGLKGFPEAIKATFPNTEIQQCIIHQIRNSTKYVSYKDIKAVMADLKEVYKASSEEVAIEKLESFNEKWGDKYPQIYKSWSEKWNMLSTYFKYPQAVREIIYTTNTIESYNRQLRKVTKSKSVFPSDDALLKSLYLATIDATKKWTAKHRSWSYIRPQLSIFFEERLKEYGLD